jgi:hypothetical protein
MEMSTGYKEELVLNNRSFLLAAMGGFRRYSVVYVPMQKNINIICTAENLNSSHSVCQGVPRDFGNHETTN